MQVGVAHLEDAGVDAAHRDHQLLLLLLRADDVELVEEVLSDSDERVPRPPTEPVHGAARDEARELEGAIPELLSHLQGAGRTRGGGS